MPVLATIWYPIPFAIPAAVPRGEGPHPLCPPRPPASQPHPSVWTVAAHLRPSYRRRDELPRAKALALFASTIAACANCSVPTYTPTDPSAIVSPGYQGSPNAARFQSVLGKCHPPRREYRSLSAGQDRTAEASRPSRRYPAMRKVVVIHRRPAIAILDPPFRHDPRRGHVVQS